MSYFPTTYAPAGSDQAPGEGRASRFFELRKLGLNESATFRLCGTHETGHVICGYSYFTASGRPRRSQAYPVNYLDDIGLSYEGKINGTGEKDTPKYFLSVTALHKESNEFVIVTITQATVRSALEEIMAMPDYQFIDGIANFFVTIKKTPKGGRDGKGVSYPMIPTLKAPTTAEVERWKAEANGIWLPALYSGADPFAGRPAEGGDPVGLPPTYRDNLGADREIATMPAGW